MTLETYMEIYEKAPAEKLIDLMRDEAYYISCDARSAGWYAAVHNEECRVYSANEVEHHKKRFAWLADTLQKRLEDLRR